MKKRVGEQVEPKIRTVPLIYKSETVVDYDVDLVSTVTCDAVVSHTYTFVTPGLENQQPWPELYMRPECLSLQTWVDSPHKRDGHCSGEIVK